MHGIEDETDDWFEFYPEREISKTDFDRVREIFEWYHDDENDADWWELNLLVRPTVVLFPDRKLEFCIDDKVWEKMKKELSQYKGDWVHYPNMTATLFLAFPDRRKKLDVGDNFFDEANGILRATRNTNWNSFVLLAHNLSILFPDRIKELGLDQQAFDGMMKALEEKRNEKNWFEFGFLATCLILLFPDRKSDLHLDREAMSWMRERFERDRGSDNLTDYLCMAMFLYVLCAERAEIAKDGRILVIPKKPKLIREPRPLPQKRNF